MLRNLSNEAITGITKYINECWRQGQLPRQWKTAKVVLIPKPGKKPQLDALRPISLTSCVAKIMKHVVLRRINDFMERNQLFPHTMVRFRPHLSTQDVMLRLKHQIIDGEKSSHLGTRVILGLDLTKAFDTIRHDAVLENLEKLGVGRRTFNYIQDFLSDRTAQISIGGVTSDDINLSGRGTPQGSVLSPYLFNVAMIELPVKLSKIEGLHHSIYADDIALWMAGGCDGFIQDTLQEAIRTIEDRLDARRRALLVAALKSAYTYYLRVYRVQLLHRWVRADHRALYGEPSRCVTHPDYVPSILNIPVAGARDHGPSGVPALQDCDHSHSSSPETDWSRDEEMHAAAGPSGMPAVQDCDPSHFPSRETNWSREEERHAAAGPGGVPVLQDCDHSHSPSAETDWSWDEEKHEAAGPSGMRAFQDCDHLGSPSPETDRSQDEEMHAMAGPSGVPVLQNCDYSHSLSPETDWPQDAERHAAAGPSGVPVLQDCDHSHSPSPETVWSQDEERHAAAGGTCESRCLESGVSTDPEPCGFARPRLAVRGFPVSGEKGILVVEPSPGTTNANKDSIAATLRDVIRGNNLIDVKTRFPGFAPRYTGWHGGSHARLDRLYVSGDPIPRVGSYYVKMVPFSDHGLVTTEIKGGAPSGRRPRGPWKTNMAILDDEGFSTEELKGEIRNRAECFPRAKAAAARQEERDLTNTLRAILEEEERRPGVFAEDVKYCKKRLLELHKERLKEAQVRSRERNLEGETQPTKIFRTFERKRAEANHISSVSLEGHHANGQEEVAAAFERHYSDLFRKEEGVSSSYPTLLRGLPVISEELREITSAPIRESEIRRAIQKISSNKAPGPDGIGAEFYKKYVDLLCPTLVEVFRDIFECKLLPPSMRESLTVLIAKKKAKKSNQAVTDYRPIRRQQVKGTTPWLSFSSISAKRSTVAHCFLQAVLRGCGVGDTMCDWVALCYRNISTRLLANGERGSSIGIGRSVRQGCPLSPIVFALQLEPMCQAINRDEAIGGLQLGRFQPLSVRPDSSSRSASSQSRRQAKTFFVRLHLGVLPVKVWLDDRGLLVPWSTNCDLCGANETLPHVFVECSNAYLFWDEMRKDLGVDFPIDWHVFRFLDVEGTDTASSMVLPSIVFLGLHAISLARSAMVECHTDARPRWDYLTSRLRWLLSITARGMDQVCQEWRAIEERLEARQLRHQRIRFGEGRCRAHRC
ncbi:hypothetical protein ISCGN_002272 [Ixodes scapularis]